MGRCRSGKTIVDDEYTSLCEECDASIRPSDIEVYNAIGVSKQYDYYLCHLLNCVMDSHNSIKKHDALFPAVKAVSETVGPKGLVPKLLVFCNLLRSPVQTKNCSTPRARFAEVSTASNEIVELIALGRLSKALHTSVPVAADQKVHIGEEFLIFNEKEKRWMGSYTIINSLARGLVVDI